jgi:uncharacterized membrane protein YgdD (TMEM256/DUF423 family)
VSRIWLSLAAVYGLLGVLCGAFGAHALRSTLAPELLSVWKTAVDYQFYHALALGLVGLLLRAGDDRSLQVAGACFASGVLVFSGSLYALALSGVGVLGAVTPIGGVLFLSGWAALGVSALRRS